MPRKPSSNKKRKPSRHETIFGRRRRNHGGGGGSGGGGGYLVIRTEVGQYQITGFSVNINTLALAVGQYAITGIAARIVLGKLDTDIGQFTITGFPVSLLGTPELPVDTGTFLIIGLPVTLSIISNESTSLGTPFTLPAQKVGFNINELLADDWSAAGILSSTADISPDTLRIPGGTVANFFDPIKGGVVPVITGMPGQFLSTRVQNYSAGKPADMEPIFTASGATYGIVVVNMLTSVAGMGAVLQQQLDYIQACLTAGLPIKCVELGNEFYNNQTLNVQAFPNPSDYNALAVTWVTAIHAAFPTLDISVIGVNPRVGAEHGDERLITWNPIVIAGALAVTGCTALTIHEYQTCAADPAVMMANVFTDSRTMLDTATRNIPAGKYIHVTEYDRLKGTGRWIDGMYKAMMRALFNEEPKITVTTAHNLLGNADFGAIYGDSAVVGPTGQAPFILAASGHTLKMYAQASLDGVTGYPLIFTTEGLYGFVFETAGGIKNSLIFNHSNAVIPLEKPGYYGSNPTYQQIYADPEQVIGAVLPTEVTGTLSTFLNLPPYSMTLLKQ